MKEYADYNINNLIRSLDDETQPTTAEMINAVSIEIGVNPKAENRNIASGQTGTIIYQNLLYMVLKLGERVIELEDKTQGGE